MICCQQASPQPVCADGQATYVVPISEQKYTKQEYRILLICRLIFPRNDAATCGRTRRIELARADHGLDGWIDGGCNGVPGPRAPP